MRREPYGSGCAGMCSFSIVFPCWFQRHLCMLNPYLAVFSILQGQNLVLFTYLFIWPLSFSCPFSLHGSLELGRWPTLTRRSVCRCLPQLLPSTSGAISHFSNCLRDKTGAEFPLPQGRWYDSTTPSQISPGCFHLPENGTVLQPLCGTKGHILTRAVRLLVAAWVLRSWLEQGTAFKHLGKASLDRCEPLKMKVCKIAHGSLLYQLNYLALVMLAWGMWISWLAVLCALSNQLNPRTWLSLKPSQMKKTLSLNKWDRPDINFQVFCGTSSFGLSHRYRFESSSYKGCFMSVSFAPLLKFLCLSETVHTKFVLLS